MKFFKPTQNNNKINKAGIYYLIYLLYFCVLYGIVVSIFHTNGKSMVGQFDAHNQYWPAFVYQWRTFLNGKFFNKFDLSIGLGADKRTALYYYGLYNPIHYFSLLFPKEKLNYAWELVLGIKLFLGGITFLLYCKSRKHLSLYAVCGASIYVFTNYLLNYAFLFFTFFDVCYTLPILVMGIDSVLEEKELVNIKTSKRAVILLILATFWQALNGFYFLYMQCFIGGMYFIARIIYYAVKDKYFNLKVIFNKVVIASIGMIGGLVLSSPVLIPGLYAYINSSRSGQHELYQWKFFVPSLHTVLDNIFYFLTPCSALLSFWPVIVVMGLLGLIISWKKHKEVFGLLLFAYVGTTIPALGGVLNGFSYIIDRGYFFFLFIFAYVIVIGLEELEQEKVKSIALGCVLISIYIIAQIVITGFEDRRYYYLLCLVIVLFCLVFKIISDKLSNRYYFYIPVLALTVLTEVIHIAMMFTPLPIIGGLDQTRYFVDSAVIERELTEPLFTDNKEFKNSIANPSDIDDVEWYRCDFLNAGVLNYSLLYDCPSVSEYFSISNPNISELYHSLGIGGGVYGMRGWKALESLCSVKYYESSLGVENESKLTIDDGLVTNDSALPIGIFYNQVILENDAVDLLGPARAALMLDTVILNEGDSTANVLQNLEKNSGVKQINNNDIYAYVQPIDCEVTYENISAGETGKELLLGKNGKITIMADASEILEGEIFLELVNASTNDWHNMLINDEQIIKYEGDEVSYIKICDWKLNNDIIDRKERLETTISFATDDASLSVDTIRLWVYSEKDYRASIDEALGRTVVNWDIDKEKLWGEIEAPSTGLLLFTIPYSAGWRAWVDGEVVDTIRADDAFMAIPIEKGLHQISLKYIGMR